MKLLFNSLLLICGLCGAGIAFLSDVTVNSSVSMLNGMELSIVLGVFCVIIIINAIVNMFSSD